MGGGSSTSGITVASTTGGEGRCAVPFNPAFACNDFFGEEQQS